MFIKYYVYSVFENTIMWKILNSLMNNTIDMIIKL